MAKGRFTPWVSDVNLLVVMARTDFGFLLPLAPVLTAALRESRLVSFLVTPEDLRVSAQLFPGEKLRIQERVVAGEIELAWSYILDFENTANPFQERRAAVRLWRARSVVDVVETPRFWKPRNPWYGSGFGRKTRFTSRVRPKRDAPTSLQRTTISSRSWQAILRFWRRIPPPL